MCEDGKVVWWPQMARNLRKHCRKMSSEVGIVPRAYGVLFGSGRKAGGGDVRYQGNPLVGPIPLPQGWTSIVHLRRVESSHKVRARNQEKRYRESRGIVRFQRRTLWMDPPAEFPRKREGRWRQERFVMALGVTPPS